MKYKIVIFLTFLTVILTGCKDKAHKADDLRLENKFSEAAELYKQAADEGNAYAKWRLAKAYDNGDGVDYDKERAWSLLNEASNAGCPQAKYDVAASYIHGWYGAEKDVKKGKLMLQEHCESTKDSYSLSCYALSILSDTIFERNEEKALEILDQIKDKDDPQYLSTMAYIYLSGIDNIEQDKNKGMDYLKKAYQNGKSRAAFLLGSMYLEDNPPTKKDINKAIEWFEKGIKKNDTRSMIEMANISLSEDSLYVNWHDAKRGLSLLEKAGRHGDGDAYAQLGAIFGSGSKDVYVDEEKAFEYYLKAQKLKSEWGINNLAACFVDGIGCEKDIDKAISLFKESSELGYGKASDNLYRYYYQSTLWQPHKIDLALAKEYLLLAVKQYDTDANEHLGWHYYTGSNLFEKNLFKAFDYLKQAADMGSVNACQQIGYMYENGIGCNRNPDKAKEYYDKTKPKGADKEEDKENQ